MNSCGIGILALLKKVRPPRSEFFRSRYWKPEPDPDKIFRHGNKDDHFYVGLLPRGDFNRLGAMKIYRPKDVWTKKKKTFGQNDYIDILGDERLHPIKLAENVPNWLKGFKGDEIDTLRLRMITFRHRLPHLKPLRWKKMQTRFEQLFYFKNYRKKVRLPST